MTPIGKAAKAFGQVLREIRKEKGMSQERLAFIAEVDRTYPSLLERGLRTPTLTFIFKLADALEVKPDEMVDRTQKIMRTL